MFIIYKGNPPRAELQSGIGVACGVAVFWLLLSVGAPRPEQSASPWGLTPAILLVVVSILLTIEILEKGHRAQPESRPSSPLQASSPPLPPKETQQLCSICYEPTLYDICNRCRGKYKDERQRVDAHLRRARQANELATLTLPEWIQILDIHNYRCAYCFDGAYQVLEHRIPIGQGNPHKGGTTAINCVPACRSCNAAKANRHPHDQPAPSMIRQRKRT